MSQHQNQRSTAPYAPPAQPILSDTSQVQLRATCPACRGRRTLDTVGYARCDVCGKAHHGDTLNSAHALPCGHIPREGRIRLRYEPCEKCGGDGHVYEWVALDPVIEFALRFIVENYDSFSQAVTAILPKLPRAM